MIFWEQPLKYLESLAADKLPSSHSILSLIYSFPLAKQTMSVASVISQLRGLVDKANLLIPKLSKIYPNEQQWDALGDISEELAIAAKTILSDPLLPSGLTSGVVRHHLWSNRAR